jgi:hypothetical protein
VKCNETRKCKQLPQAEVEAESVVVHDDDDSREGYESIDDMGSFDVDERGEAE